MSKLKIRDQSDPNTWYEVPSGGVGVPSGGTQGQALLKTGPNDHQTGWGDVATSVNGQTGAVTVQPTIKTGSVTLAANWTGSGPYTQTVTVTGVTVTADSKVDIQPDATAIMQLVSDGVYGLYIENNSGTLTAYAIGAAPTANLTVQVTIIEVS